MEPFPVRKVFHNATKNFRNFFTSLSFPPQLVVQLTPTTASKKSLMHHLSKGSALILFIPMKLNMNTSNVHLLHTVGYFYLSPMNWHCFAKEA